MKTHKFTALEYVFSPKSISFFMSYSGCHFLDEVRLVCRCTPLTNEASMRSLFTLRSCSKKVQLVFMELINVDQNCLCAFFEAVCSSRRKHKKPGQWWGTRTNCICTIKYGYAPVYCCHVAMNTVSSGSSVLSTRNTAGTSGGASRRPSTSTSCSRKLRRTPTSPTREHLCQYSASTSTSAFWWLVFVCKSEKKSQVRHFHFTWFSGCQHSGLSLCYL